MSRFLRCMTIEFLVFQISLCQFKKSNTIFVEKYISCASLCIRIVYYSVIIDGKNVRIDRMRIRKGREKEDLFKMMNTKLQPYRLYAAIIQINMASPKFISLSLSVSTILKMIHFEAFYVLYTFCIFHKMQFNIKFRLIYKL